jgi:hypothetical protein
MKRAVLAAASLALLGGLLAIILSSAHVADFEDALTLGDALVAGGTLALALVTFWLAWQTKREVGNSKESIELSREAIVAQDMPFVIASSNPDQHRDLDTTTSNLRLWWRFGDEGEWLLQLRLWNIGRGPAIAGDIRLGGAGRDILGARPTDIGEIVIGPGQVYDLVLPVVGGDPPLDSEDVRGVMRIYYRHIAGAEYMTNSLALIGDQGVRPANLKRLLSDGEGRSVA